MAIETPIDNPAVKQVERTKTVTWATMEGVPHSVEMQRETVRLDANDVNLGTVGGGRVLRPYDRVKNETADVNGKTISVAEMAEAQAILSDRWAAEDDAHVEHHRKLMEQRRNIPMPKPPFPMHGIV